MNAKHTPGPWATGWGNGISGPGTAWRFRAFEADNPAWRAKAKDEAVMLIGPSSVGTGANSLLAMLPKDENGEANAARIVACVNALDGLNPEAVPELVAALKKALYCLRFVPMDANDPNYGSAALLMAEAAGESEAALLKAKGESA